MIIDSHSHVYLNEFSTDIPEVLERAAKEGVGRILMPAIDSETHELQFKIESENSVCLSMMGLHPCSVKENFLEELSIVKAHLNQRNFIAIGEIGLDFYWDLNFKSQQIEAFRQQIEWALEFDLPVSIHSRNATDECIEVVSSYTKKGLRGAFHCFSGDLIQAQKIIELGMYLGIGGVLTFKNSGLDVVIKEVELKHLILETDAPYLAPVPFRGKRNEPSYLKYVLQKLADIKGVTVDKVADETTKNAQHLFRL